MRVSALVQLLICGGTVSMFQLLKESGCSTAAVDRNQEIQNNPVHIQIPVGNQQIQKSTVQTGCINFKGYNRTVISVRS